MSTPRSETILVTSSIVPADVEFLSMRDPAERLRQTVAALLCWFDHPAVRVVVFCDNSGVDIDLSPLARIAEDRGVFFEPILFSDNEIARRLGKGAGEGRILDRAMNESRVLSHCESFWKCTAKFFVANFSEIAASRRSDSVVFTRPGWNHQTPFDPAQFGFVPAAYRWTRSRVARLAKRVLHGFDPNANVNTQFWKCDVAFFDRVLRHCYTTVNDRRRYFIEHAYARAMRGMTIAPFDPVPLIVGRSGSIEATYGGGLPSEMLDLADGVVLECRRDLRAPSL